MLRTTPPFFLLCAAVSLFSALRQRNARLADQEAREEQLERREQPQASLFDNQHADEPILPLAYSSRQFERWLVPVFSGLVLAFELGCAWWLLRAPRGADAMPYNLTALFLGGQALAMFLAGKYCLGLARMDCALHGAGSDPRKTCRPVDRTSDIDALLHAPGSLCVLCAFVCAAGALGTALPPTRVPQFARIAVPALAAILGLMGAEIGLRLLWDMYRPRSATPVCRTPYESTLAAMLASPTQWANDAVENLNYQFGFELSDSWFYRFTRKVLLPLLLFQGITLYLLSCLVFLEPHEQAILERFGNPRSDRPILNSGFHLKRPWPFETIRRYPTKRIQTLHVGFVQGTNRPAVMVWTIPHFEREYPFLVANRAEAGDTEQAKSKQVGRAVPVNLLNVNVPVEYLITNLYQFAYTYSDPKQILEQAAYRAVSLESVSRDIFAMMGPGQLAASQSLHDAVQAEVDRLRLGVQIVFVSLQGIHPPVPVADAFESVVGALEQRETAILAAHTHATKVQANAQALAHTTVTEAEAYRYAQISISAAQADRFLKRLESFTHSPEVFKLRTYLGALRTALTDVRKFIITVPTASEVIQFHFEKERMPDLFGLDPDTDPFPNGLTE